MKYREKLGYIVLGGVLMLVGILAAVEVAVENVGLVSLYNGDGEVMAMMSATDEFGGDIRVVGKDGKSEARMRVNELGGEVTVCGKDGRTGAKAIMGITPFFGGTIAVTSEDGKMNGLMVE